MKSTKPTIKIQQKVEQMAIFFEKSGLTPMHGRVFAYLLLAEPPHKDFTEIQEFLNASKSAISNALKFLMNEGTVDYVKFSGDRKRYFRVDMEGWFNRFKKDVRKITTLSAITEGVLDERADSKHLDFNEKLEQMIDFQNQLAQVLEVFIDDWENKNKMS